MRAVVFRLLAFWLVGLGLGWNVTPRAFGAETPPAVVSLAVTNDLVVPEAVVRRMAALSNRTDLAVGIRTNALALYAEAEQRLTEARRLAEDSVRLHAEVTNAPAVLANLQAVLAAPVTGVVGSLVTNGAVAELEQQLASTDAELSQATKEQDALLQEPSRRSSRLAELTRLISETRQIRERILQESRAPQPAEWDPEIRQANRDLLQSRVQYREAELLHYEEEQANLNATADATRLRLDLARRRVAALTQDRETLTAALNRRREQDSLQASLQAAQATRRAEALNEPWLLLLARTNTVLAQNRAALAERLKSVSVRLDMVTSNRLALRESFQSLRDRVDAAERAGLSRNFAIGLLLRRQQTTLQVQGDHRELARQQLGAISDAQIAQFAAVDARRSIEPLELVASTLVRQLSTGADPERNAVLLQESKSLLGAQRELLASLVRDYDTFLALLFRFQSALEESAGVVDEFAAYLDQRVLWIRSTEPIGVGVIRREASSVLAVFLSPDWKQTRALVLEELRRLGASGWGLLAGTVFLLSLRGRFLRQMNEAAVVARQGRNTDIRPTLHAVGYTVLRVLPLPLLLWLFGRTVMSATVGASGTLGTLGPAVMMLATVLLVLGILREICHPEGLAIAHFRMPEGDVGLFRRALTIGLVFLPLLAFFNRLLEGEFSEGVSNRLIFIPTVLACAVLAHRVLHPERGLGASQVESAANPKAARLWRRIVYASAVLLPLLLAAASALGYNYSARHLWVRFLTSILTAIGLKLVSAVLFRWIYLTRRKLAMAYALKQRPATGEGGEPAVETPSVVEDTTQSDLLTSMGQARRLLNWAYGLTLVFSLFAIWSATLPALQALDQIPLWNLERPAGGSASAGVSVLSAATGGAGGASATSEGESGTAGAGNLAVAGSFVSVWDLVLVLLTVSVVVTVTSNLPGFLEMAVFSHVQLERGTSYAITTTLRYGVILVGIIATAQGLGLQWSQVQWLAAAVTLGIGFGLQEIFANFVSGLILLFERPVRIGDIVTVGDVSGVVSRIQIRATTIRDWDNRELILPNKELITGRFVNWTLSDSVTRIVCTVGIAYESDVRQAQALLLELARRHPAVLADPAPLVTFDSFGDSSVNLSLRVHVGRTDQRASTLFDLNTSILEEFQKAGISIAYPQREVTVRLLQPDTPPAKGPGAA
jgi:potassium efflux system protein